MSLNHICLGCMEEKGEEQRCSFCGWVEGAQPESLQHLSPGFVLQNKYLLGAAIGQGGFGITYLAFDMNLNLKLAVKEYLPQQLATRSVGESEISVLKRSLQSQFQYGLGKFLEEARTLARFNEHPNVVTVRDYFEENSTAYLVMNYHEGVNLKEYLQQRGSALPFQQALNIFMPVFDALNEIHAAGILHRDISPDNLLINTRGQVVIIDFGAARQAMGEKSRSLSVIMKAGFSPVEQYYSRGVQGPWTDIYAAAATFYLIIAGCKPPEALDRVVDDQLVPPSALGVSIEPYQEEALLRALAVKAEDRYQHVDAFRRDLLPLGAIEVQEPAAEAQEAVVQGREPAVQGREAVVEGREPAMEGREPVVQGREPVVQGREPVVQGREPAVEGREPVVEGREPAVQGRQEEGADYRSEPSWEHHRSERLVVDIDDCDTQQGRDFSGTDTDTGSDSGTGAGGDSGNVDSIELYQTGTSGFRGDRLVVDLDDEEEEDAGDRVWGGEHDGVWSGASGEGLNVLRRDERSGAQSERRAGERIEGRRPGGQSSARAGLQSEEAERGRSGSRDQASSPGAAPPPPPPAPLTGSALALKNLKGYGVSLKPLVLAGLVGGFITSIITAVLFDFYYYADYRIFHMILVEMVAFSAIMGGIIGACLGSVEGIGVGVQKKAVNGGLTGLFIGVVGAALGAVIGQAIYSMLGGGNITHLPLLLTVRSLFWGLVGLFIGFGQGIGAGGGERAKNGLLGGLIGGLIGGISFDLFFLLFSSPYLSGLVSLVVFGSCVGLGIGMVQEFRKEAWLKVARGPMAGKEFIVHRQETTLGADLGCDIVLLKEPAVAAVHARIKIQDKRFFLQVEPGKEEITVNGDRVRRAWLKNGDGIGIGAYQLVFHEKNVGEDR